MFWIRDYDDDLVNLEHAWRVFVSGPGKNGDYALVAEFGRDIMSQHGTPIQRGTKEAMRTLCEEILKKLIARQNAVDLRNIMG